jgi:hypothetical protein
MASHSLTYAKVVAAAVARVDIELQAVVDGRCWRDSCIVGGVMAMLPVASHALSHDIR